MSRFHRHFFVCQTQRPPLAKPSCGAKGSAEIFNALQEALGAHPDLWGIVSVTSSGCLGPCFDGPTIVFGRADMRLTREPAVFLPVATPGIDADGHLLRTDKVVSLYLRRLRTSALPSVAQAIEALMQRLGSKARQP